MDKQFHPLKDCSAAGTDVIDLCSSSVACEGGDHGLVLQKLWQAIENLPEGIAFFDEAERLLLCNQSYQSLGLRPQKRVANTNYDDQGRRHILRHLPSLGVLELCFDITDLSKAYHAKSQALADVAHEIRTPISGILGMAELLCAAPLAVEQKLYTETIRSSAEALLTLINDFLDHTKLEAQQKALRHQPVDLERLIHEVMMLLQGSAQRKSLDLLIDYDIFLPTHFVSDPGRLRQIFTNLLGNAVKFTDQGHVLVRVVGLEASGKHQLHITIEDSGCGIPFDKIDHIFKAYQQLDTHKNQGSGLGLGITKELVEQLGGAIWVDSQIDKGSVFGVKLPLEPSQNQEPPRPQMAFKQALVVNSRYLNRRILERQLSQYAIEATLCYDAKEALETLATDQRFDVAIIDQDLPDMKGDLLSTALKERGHNFPSILLHHQNLSGTAKKAAYLLHKPYLRSELYQALHGLSQLKTRPMRVLAAEDNQTNRMIFQMMVNDLDIDLVFAEDGEEAITYWQHFEPDIIFMDISMPKISGVAATRHIRGQETRPTPIIALSAHQDEKQFADAGFDGFMTKPLRKPAILEALKRYQPDEARL